MNTNALKKFAQETRRKLMQQVAAKLEFVLTGDTPELRENSEQVKNLKLELQKTTKKELVDKVAYTWFNRFMALRFMDANDYQPLGLRVISPLTNQTSPEILSLAKQGDIASELKVDTKKVLDILDGRVNSSNPQNEAFKILLIGACNHLSSVLPFLFEKINDYTELLLTDDLTSEFSVITDMVKGMSEEECHEVELIGWLYQFYISEKKDEVFASKSKVKKEDIPAATQLFTPRWIVEYMVQNTLGKLWLQNKPNSKLREHMHYFIESASVQSEDYLKVTSPEEIKLLDQACGSGHILVYSFDLLTKIYEEEGYSQSEIATLIITKNLFGFEIDERAAQLAGMALLMKARDYQRRLFKKEDVPEPNILCYKDLNLTSEEIKTCLTRAGIKPSDELFHDLNNMQQATNLGSLILPHAVKSEIENTFKKLGKTTAGGDIFYELQISELKQAFSQLLLLADKYHCVVDNPPYMSDGSMNKPLSNFVKTNYSDSKTDLMACFIESGLNILHKNGFLGMINQHSWMFLGSYEKLRFKLINSISFDTMLHLGPRTFPEIGGEVVQNTSFTFQKTITNGYSKYIRLVSYNKSELKRINAIKAIKDDNSELAFKFRQDSFTNLPGAPITYWLSDKIVSSFKLNKIGDYVISKAGIVSGNDNFLLRFWHELSLKNISFNQTKFDKGIKEDYVPMNKGGAYRKYFGNQEHVINLRKLWDGESTNHSVRRGAPDFYFKKAITWSYISNVNFGFRLNRNVVYGTQSPAIFLNDEKDYFYILGLLNSKFSSTILPAINPTVSLVTSNIEAIPLMISSELIDEINSLVKEQLTIHEEEWNSNELAWDYKMNELIKNNSQELEKAFDLFKLFWKKKFLKAHENEVKLNEHYLTTYGLQDEISSVIDLNEITLLKDIKEIQNNELKFINKEVFSQFISYGVGCMFGRYSLDKEGLIMANQGEKFQDYLSKVEKSKMEVTFLLDDDNIIPILDDEWFEDDIVGRFYEFLKASFGEPNFRKNLAFVEEQIGDIRKYFVKSFYSDHIKRYKKRPIYWMFSSPKGHFNVLVYMHRYTPDTINNILNNYLREFIEKLKSRKEHFAQIQISGSAVEQTKAIKEIDKLEKMLLDCQEYERDILYKLATERIEIDLEDGVLVNYNKFGNALKEVAGLNDKKTKKKVREFDWIDATQIR